MKKQIFKHVRGFFLFLLIWLFWSAACYKAMGEHYLFRNYGRQTFILCEAANTNNSWMIASNQVELIIEAVTDLRLYDATNQTTPISGYSAFSGTAWGVDTNKYRVVITFGNKRPGASGYVIGASADLHQVSSEPRRNWEMTQGISNFLYGVTFAFVLALSGAGIRVLYKLGGTSTEL